MPTLNNPGQPLQGFHPAFLIQTHQAYFQDSSSHLEDWFVVGLLGPRHILPVNSLLAVTLQCSCFSYTYINIFDLFKQFFLFSCVPKSFLFVLRVLF